MFNFAQDALGVPRGTIRATVLIETILASFEMDEILYELRIIPRDSTADAGTTFSASSRNSAIIRNSCCRTAPKSRWTRHFLKSYVELLIQTCHRRGIHAMGGMAAQVPIKNDPAANEAGAGKSSAG